MAIRIAALACWVLILAATLPAASFGWIASLLAAGAVVALIAPLGVPYLFFRAVHRRENGEARKYLREAISALVLMGPLMAALSTWGIVFWLGSPVPYLWVLLFLILEVALSSFVQVGALWMHARGRPGSAACFPALLTVSRAVAAALMLGLGLSSEWVYLLLHLLGTAVVAALVGILVQPFRFGVPRPRVPPWSTFVHSVGYGLMGAGSVVSGELDKPLIARMLGLGVAGVYSIAYRLVATMATPSTALAAAMLPRWSAMAEQGDQERMRQTFLLSCLAALFFGAAVMFVVRAVTGAEMQSHWGDYSAVPSWMDRLAWLVAAIGLHQVAGTALIAAGRPLLRAVVDLTCFAGLVASLPMLYRSYGFDGVAFVLVTTELAAGAIMALIFYARPCRPSSIGVPGAQA